MTKQGRAFRGALAALALACGVAAATPSRGADLPPVPDIAALDLPAPRAATPFFVRVGASADLLDERFEVKVAGHHVPGGGGRIPDVASLYVEGGMFVTDHVSVALSAGFPPTLTSKGTGSLAGDGTIMRAVVGVPVLSASYHLDPFHGLSPYVGVGVAYAMVFDAHAGALHSPHLGGAVGPALVAGVDYAIDDHWGVFVDVKKTFLRQEATGFVSPAPGLPAVAPTRAWVRSDPLIVSAGVQYRF